MGAGKGRQVRRRDPFDNPVRDADKCERRFGKLSCTSWGPGAPGEGVSYGRIVTLRSTGGVMGLLFSPSEPVVTGAWPTLSTTSMPFVTRPKIT
jgi:hypothetical protein